MAVKKVTDSAVEDTVTVLSGDPKVVTETAGDPKVVEALAGRPNDIPLRKDVEPAVAGSTFAERAKLRRAAEKRSAESAVKK